MRAAKVQASLRIRAVSPEPSLLAHTSRTFRQKARSLAPLNGWACAVKICHDGMFEDTNSLDGAQTTGDRMIFIFTVCRKRTFHEFSAYGRIRKGLKVGLSEITPRTSGRLSMIATFFLRRFLVFYSFKCYLASFFKEHTTFPPNIGPRNTLNKIKLTRKC